MKTMVLASRNPGKIRELREILSDLDITLKSALDFSDLDEVVEDQDTLEGNALKKARHACKKTALPSLADDTGLEVKALGGKPGVYSARYAGDGASDRENLEKLLADMNGLSDKDRRAQFRTVVAFVDPSGKEFTFEGICLGFIRREPKGERGFGYDPIFQPEGYDRTFAQLDAREKNRISHRGKAIRRFHAWLKAR